jgi:flagellar biosynthesis/type III secretory pathway protein FliH
MVAERVAMTTIDEVYFLVRVGSWDEDDLENYIQERAEESNQEHYDDGFKSGLEEGVETGRELMYKEAVEAVKCLM